MTKNEIVSNLSLSGVVESLITNVTKGPLDENLKDLAQDIYLELLTKDDALIEDLWKKKELIYYTVRIITNNIFSQNSPYYYKYVKYKNNRQSIDECDDNKLPNA